MSRITVAIPVHKMDGGVDFLRHSLNIISRQKFRDFDVVISDNSRDRELFDVIKEFPTMPIVFEKYTTIGMAPNTNHAMDMAQGELIKILYLDDYLFGNEALGDIDKSFKKNDHWLVTGCAHTSDGVEIINPHYPNYHENIHTGANTIGSPSVLTVRNEGHLTFEDSLTWLLDCDLYRRYHDTYGLPKILNSLNVVIRQGDHQMTNIISRDIKMNEHEYLIEKYK